jgi:hypothetical protein
VLALAAAPASAALGASSAQLPTARQLYKITTPAVDEASGVAVAPGGLTYTFNDSGNAPVIYGYSDTGALRTQVTVPSKDEDWEDMAITDVGGTWKVFLADTGDDFQDRKAAGLPDRSEYAIVELDVPAGPSATDTGTTVTKEDAVGTRRFTVEWPDHSNHNGETMLVQPDTGQIYVADKIYDAGQPAYLWAAPKKLSAKSPNVLTKVGSIPIMAASGGAISQDGTRMVIRNGETAFLWTITPQQKMSSVLKAAPVQLQLPHQPQGEGVGFSQDGTGLLLTSEGTDQPLWQVDLPTLLRPAAWASTGQPPSKAALAAARGDTVSTLPVLATGAGGLLLLVAVGLALEARRRRR